MFEVRTLLNSNANFVTSLEVTSEYLGHVRIQGHRVIAVRVYCSQVVSLRLKGRLGLGQFACGTAKMFLTFVLVSLIKIFNFVSVKILEYLKTLRNTQYCIVWQLLVTDWPSITKVLLVCHWHLS